jgi:5-formyltetrahydrofolate cyclo-ligase
VAAPDNEHLGKPEWRARILAERRQVPPRQRVAEDAALAESVATLAASTVCCYLPFGTEPGSPALVEALHRRGVRVLLPVIPPRPGALDWARYEGPSSLVPGPLRGVLEPAGARGGPAAIAEADVVLTPALAVDRRGVRLGRGAGYYDRSLALAAPGTTIVAVIRDTELLDRLPAEEHDVRMHAALMPRRGLVRLPEGTASPGL